LRTTGAGFIERHGGFPLVARGESLALRRHLSARRPATGDAATLLPLQSKIKETAAPQHFSSTAIILKARECNEIAGFSIAGIDRVNSVRRFSGIPRRLYKQWSR